VAELAAKRQCRAFSHMTERTIATATIEIASTQRIVPKVTPDRACVVDFTGA